MWWSRCSLQLISGQLNEASASTLKIKVRPTLLAGGYSRTPFVHSHLPIEQAAALVAEDAAAQASDGVGGGPVIGGVI